MRSAYEVLQVAESVDDEILKLVYKRLAAKAHPDKGGDPEVAKEINWAYDTLSDPEKRRKHDAELATERARERLSEVFDERLERVRYRRHYDPYYDPYIGHYPVDPRTPRYYDGGKTRVTQVESSYTNGATRVYVHPKN